MAPLLEYIFLHQILSLQRYISFEVFWEAEKGTGVCFCNIIPSELPFLGLFGKAQQCQFQSQKQVF